jgi:predicted DNA-binding WGR domain protein
MAMDRLPVIASAEDIPPALEFAHTAPESKWYIVRRAVALGVTNLLPEEWSPLIASYSAPRPVEVLQAPDAASAGVPMAVTAAGVSVPATLVAAMESYLAGEGTIRSLSAQLTRMSTELDDEEFEDFIESYQDYELISEPEAMALTAARYVRTPEGARRFNAPIGAMIIDHPYVAVRDVQLVNQSDGSNKAYGSSVIDTGDGSFTHVQSWGKIGTKGQTKFSTYPDKATAVAQHDAIVDAKKKRGYVTADNADRATEDAVENHAADAHMQALATKLGVKGSDAPAAPVEPAARLDTAPPASDVSSAEKPSGPHAEMLSKWNERQLKAAAGMAGVSDAEKAEVQAELDYRAKSGDVTPAPEVLDTDAPPAPEGGEHVDKVPESFDVGEDHRWILPNGDWVDFDQTTSMLSMFDGKTGEEKAHISLQDHRDTYLAEPDAKVHPLRTDEQLKDEEAAVNQELHGYSIADLLRARSVDIAEIEDEEEFAAKHGDMPRVTVKEPSYSEVSISTDLARKLLGHPKRSLPASTAAPSIQEVFGKGPEGAAALKMAQRDAAIAEGTTAPTAAAPAGTPPAFVTDGQLELGTITDAKKGDPERLVPKRTLADGRTPAAGMTVVNSKGETGTISETYQGFGKVKWDSGKSSVVKYDKLNATGSPVPGFRDASDSEKKAITDYHMAQDSKAIKALSDEIAAKRGLSSATGWEVHVNDPGHKDGLYSRGTEITDLTDAEKAALSKLLSPGAEAPAPPAPPSAAPASDSFRGIPNNAREATLKSGMAGGLLRIAAKKQGTKLADPGLVWIDTDASAKNSSGADGFTAHAETEDGKGVSTFVYGRDFALTSQTDKWGDFEHEDDRPDYPSPAVARTPDDVNAEITKLNRDVAAAKAEADKYGSGTKERMTAWDKYRKTLADREAAISKIEAAGQGDLIPDAGSTLRVNTMAQKILFNDELMGQISDGMWENTGGEGWKDWADATVIVDPKHVGRNFFARKDNYLLNSKALLDIVGDRMVENVQEKHDPSYDEKRMAADLKDLRKIFKTQRSDFKGEQGPLTKKWDDWLAYTSDPNDQYAYAEWVVAELEEFGKVDTMTEAELEQAWMDAEAQFTMLQKRFQKDIAKKGK